MLHGGYLLLLSLAFLLSTTPTTAEIGYAFADSGCLRKTKHGAWMGRLPDDVDLLTSVSIPGTHDSGSYLYKNLLYKTQCSTIYEQLQAGVRFLDLRLAFIGHELVLIHGNTLIWGQSPTLESVLQSMSRFLAENPSEVIFARLKKEAGSSWPIFHDYWDADVVERTFNKFSHMVDLSCFIGFCPLGAARGHVVYLSTDNSFPFISALPYSLTFPAMQDEFRVSQINAYNKWKLIRSYLAYASSDPTERYAVGVINYLSAAVGAAPYFFASGLATPNGNYLWTGLSLSCAVGLNNAVYPDFLRGSCTCATHASLSICSIRYTGMNAMAYDWIDRGLRGVPQSREMDYVFPRTLGVVVMDFPNNRLIDRIIDVNFASKAGLPTTVGRIHPSCGRQCACLAGDTNITTLTSGVIPARKVRVGDLVPRALEDENQTGMCKVIATNQMPTSGTVNGEFTADHYIVVNRSHVTAAGDSQEASREVDLVNIATDCPAPRTTSGVGFTPLSSIFCGDGVTWREYVHLYRALMRIVRRTGTFWFDPTIYVDARDEVPSSEFLTALSKSEVLWEEGVCRPAAVARTFYSATGGTTFPVKGEGIDALTASLDDSGSSESAQSIDVPDTWVSALPPICHSLAACAVNGSSCDAFETLASAWIERHLPTDKLDHVRSAYPHMGEIDAAQGTLTADVRDDGGVEAGSESASRRSSRLAAIIAPAVVLGVLAVAAVIILVRCCLCAKKSPRVPLQHSFNQEELAEHAVNQAAASAAVIPLKITNPLVIPQEEVPTSTSPRL